MVNNLKSFEKGLSFKEAEENLKEFGINEIDIEKRKKALSIFLDQFKDILVLILAVSTALSFLLGEFLDAFAIFFLIILNGTLGFIQEYKAERALESFKKIYFLQIKSHKRRKIRSN